MSAPMIEVNSEGKFLCRICMGHALKGMTIGGRKYIKDDIKKKIVSLGDQELAQNIEKKGPRYFCLSCCKRIEDCFQFVTLLRQSKLAQEEKGMKRKATAVKHFAKCQRVNDVPLCSSGDSRLDLGTDEAGSTVAQDVPLCSSGDARLDLGTDEAGSTVAQDVPLCSSGDSRLDIGTDEAGSTVAQDVPLCSSGDVRLDIGTDEAGSTVAQDVPLCSSGDSRLDIGTDEAGSTVAQDVPICSSGDARLDLGTDEAGSTVAQEVHPCSSLQNGLYLVTDQDNPQTVVEVILQDPALMGELQQHMVDSIQADFTELSSLTNQTCLGDRSLEHMKYPEFLEEVYTEFKARCPFLFCALQAAATPTITSRRETEDRLKGMLVMVYSSLLFMRNFRLSAFQRAFTLVMTKGAANESCLRICNKLGLTLSPQMKSGLLDECGLETTATAMDLIQECCLCNLVGDNCDIRIRPRYVSHAHPVQDCHYFGMLLVFSRLAVELRALSTTLPRMVDHRCPDHYLLSEQERLLLFSSYKVLLGRIIVDHLPAFKWMEEILPLHIPHPLSEKMAQRSTTIPLKLIMKDEKKYEDCVCILEETQHLLQNLGQEDRQIPFFGDQLTRVRLQGAKNLRALAAHPHERFDDIGPFLCTLWHMKQDFLEKAYKFLWNRNSCGVRGSLMHFKALLRMVYVNGKVKSNYKAHEQLFLMVGKAYILEQFMERMNMTTYNDIPDVLPNLMEDISTIGKSLLADRILTSHLRECGYAQALTEQEGAPQDHVFNYANNICQWTMHLLHANDTAKEGDLDRTLLSLKGYIPFFFAHSNLSKYYVECLDYLQKLLFCSPQMRLRLLEGSYTNIKGGPGRNVETDLVMEHSIRNKKDLIRNLGSNKTPEAVQRVTLAADTVASVHSTFMNVLSIPRKSGYNSKIDDQADVKRIKECLRELRPFNKQCGRNFGNIRVAASPLTTGLMTRIRFNMDTTLNRLSRSMFVEAAEDETDEVDINSGDESEPELPEM